MSGRRSTTPLFEMVSRRAGGSPSSPPRGPEPARLAVGGRMSVPVYAVYLAASAALVLGLAVWAVAYQSGVRDGKQAAARILSLDNPGIASRDPLLDRPLATPGPKQSNPTDPAASAPTAFLLAGGGTSTDPRRLGNNYLRLASDVTQAEARGLVAYLAQNGVDAVAVRVEGAGRSANNPRYNVFSLFAVPSDQYGAMSSDRSRHQARVAELGRPWLADHQGTQNLAETTWELFRGP